MLDPSLLSPVPLLCMLVGAASHSAPPGEPDKLVTPRAREDMARQADRGGEPEPVTSLDKDFLRRTVLAHMHEVRYCHDLVLARDPDARGRVAIAFEIDVDGTAQAATVYESTLKDPLAGTCIAAAVMRWKFPKPSNGKVKVVYPFVLMR